MIEMASLVAETDRDDPRTVEFVVPPGLEVGKSSEDISTFTSLSSMLQGIFRMANPLVLKTTSLGGPGNNNAGGLSAMAGGALGPNNNGGYSGNAM